MQGKARVAAALSDAASDLTVASGLPSARALQLTLSFANKMGLKQRVRDCLHAISALDARHDCGAERLRCLDLCCREGA